jgi:putative glutathione S-transferase
MPGVKETVNMEQIKAHYYCSHPELNYYSIIPRGTDFVRLLEQPHDRDSM